MKAVSAMHDSRLTDLESALAFQERTLQDLSDVICRQQTEIDGMKAAFKRLSARLEHDTPPGADVMDASPEIPPHY